MGKALSRARRPSPSMPSSEREYLSLETLATDWGCSVEEAGQLAEANAQEVYVWFSDLPAEEGHYAKVNDPTLADLPNYLTLHDYHTLKARDVREVIRRGSHTITEVKLEEGNQYLWLQGEPILVDRSQLAVLVEEAKKLTGPEQGAPATL